MAEEPLKCVDCGTEFLIEQPLFQIINEKLVSMLIFVHPYQAACPKCGTAYRFELAGLKGAVMGWKKLEAADQPAIVAPPSTLDFRKLKQKN